MPKITSLQRGARYSEMRASPKTELVTTRCLVGGFICEFSEREKLGWVTAIIPSGGRGVKKANQKVFIKVNQVSGIGLLPKYLILSMFSFNSSPSSPIFPPLCPSSVPLG